MGIYKPKETSREVDYSRLLFSHRDVTVYDDPFFHGCIDNYLPSQSYRYLLQDFPKQALYINYGARGAMDNDDPRLKNFWSKNRSAKAYWIFLVPRHFSKTYKNSSCRLFHTNAAIAISDLGITSTTGRRRED